MVPHCNQQSGAFDHSATSPRARVRGAIVQHRSLARKQIAEPAGGAANAECADAKGPFRPSAIGDERRLPLRVQAKLRFYEVSRNE